MTSPRVIGSDRAAYAYGKRKGGRKLLRVRANYNPLTDTAKLLSYLMFERAKAIVEALAPDLPSDQEELEDDDVWMLLEDVAAQVSPEMWEDPNAIDDLLRLRSKFAPSMVDPQLKAVAQLRRKQKAITPDPMETPESPEFEAKVRRLSRG